MTEKVCPKCLKGLRRNFRYTDQGSKIEFQELCEMCKATGTVNFATAKVEEPQHEHNAPMVAR